MLDLVIFKRLNKSVVVNLELNRTWGYIAASDHIHRTKIACICNLHLPQQQTSYRASQLHSGPFFPFSTPKHIPIAGISKLQRMLTDFWLHTKRNTTATAHNTWNACGKGYIHLWSKLRQPLRCKVPPWSGGVQTGSGGLFLSWFIELDGCLAGESDELRDTLRRIEKEGEATNLVSRVNVSF